MRHSLRVVALAVCVVAVCWSQASADWDPGDFAKHAQLPDLTTAGMDIWEEGTGMMNADDFECTSTGPITDIHIWGSWLDDVNGGFNPQDSFMIFIYPDDRSGPYSKPASTFLWAGVINAGGPSSGTYGPAKGYYTERVYAVGGPETFWNPVGGVSMGTDTVVYQYNFYINEEDAFVQEGTPENPVIYWVGILAFPNSGDWGWKTRDPLDGHFEDDAVYYSGGWQRLIYPAGHPYEGQSIDLAFVITPEPATVALMGLGTVGTLLLRKRRR